jgi:hypothetical protein
MDATRARVVIQLVTFGAALVVVGVGSLVLIGTTWAVGSVVKVVFPGLKSRAPGRGLEENHHR